MTPYRFLRTRQVLGFIRAYPMIVVTVFLMAVGFPSRQVRIGPPIEVSGVVISEENKKATQYYTPHVLVRLDAGRIVRMIGNDVYKLSEGSTVNLHQYNRFLWIDEFELAPLAQQP